MVRPTKVCSSAGSCGCAAVLDMSNVLPECAEAVAGGGWPYMMWWCWSRARHGVVRGLQVCSTDNSGDAGPAHSCDAQYGCGLTANGAASGAAGATGFAVVSARFHCSSRAVSVFTFGVSSP